MNKLKGIDTSADQILKELTSLANPDNVRGMARFGINPHNTLGVSIPVLRSMAKKIGKDHELAESLWDSGIHEARILAALIADPRMVTEEQMECWVADFDSWDVCDQVCGNLFDRTNFAYQKAGEWCRREAEFVKRAGFVLMACLAVHDKKAADDRFDGFFPLILEGSTDERNFVKKAVNWALRQIGKRDRYLNDRAIETAHTIARLKSRTARWIARDALRELTEENIQKKL